MELLKKELIQELLAKYESPCISLYMPTHKQHPENLQNNILFNNLIRKIEESLKQKYSDNDVKKYIEPIKSLNNDKSIWTNKFEGLAVFSAKGIFKVVGLHKSLEELAIVADSFHTKPLRKYLQSTYSYHVLCLTLHNISFFEGNRHSLAEVELKDEVPETIIKALGEKFTEKHLTFGAYGGVGRESSPMYHGHGGIKEETEKDAEKYFRVVADAIYENYSKPSNWPLILVSLPEHHNLFQKVNKNPLLLETGISIDPSSISSDKLAKMAWEIMEPEYNLKLNNLVDRFKQAKADGKGSDDYKEVALAAVKGRVESLIIEANRIIPIKIADLITGDAKEKDLNSPKIDDMLDDMGELVIKMGGDVMVIPATKMPSETGLAAIFRY